MSLQPASGVLNHSLESCPVHQGSAGNPPQGPCFAAMQRALLCSCLLHAGGTGFLRFCEDRVGSERVGAVMAEGSAPNTAAAVALHPSSHKGVFLSG